MKKFLALFLALCLLAAPVLTAQAESEPTYKIAIGLPDSGSSMFSIMSSNVRAFVELTGGEVYFQAGPGSSADAAVAFVENQIAAGADALFFGPPSDSILPTICMLCEEAQVYWGICFRTIQDEEVRAFVESSPYYVGKCYEDEEGTAYDIMADLAEEGIKKVAVILMEKGNSASDQREVGLYRACEDFDMEIVAEARALTQASDITTAAESFLAAYSDLDCIFVVSTTAPGAQEAVIKAIQDAGREDEVCSATIDFPDNMDELFGTGILKVASGLAHWGYDPFITCVLLANQAMGTPISEEQISITMPMYSITDQETAAKWMERFGDENAAYYTEEEMSMLVKGTNPDLTVDSLNEMIADFTKNITEY